MNKISVKGFWVLFVCLAFFAGCGASAEEVAEENAKIEEDIKQIKTRIGELESIKVGKKVKEIKEFIKMKKEILEDMKGTAAENSPLTDGYREELKKYESDLEEAQKEIAEAGSEYDSLVKKLQDEYGISYTSKK